MIRLRCGCKYWSVILALLLLMICLAPLSAGARNNNSTPNNPNLPNGRPFQILQDEINALQKQIKDFQYQLLTLPNHGAGSEIIPITPTNFTIVAGGKPVRFEISFVPAAAAPMADTFLMEALVSPGTGNLNAIGTNSNGTITLTSSATLLPATLASISTVASLVAVTGSSFQISQTGGALGTYFVKIYY